MFEVSFPGIGDGLGPFTINSTAFTIFGIQIQWYGILIALGMILAFVYVLNRAKFEGVKSDDIIDLALCMIISGVVGARLYYVIFNFNEFLATGGSFFENFGNTFINIVSIRKGGLAIFGGLILGFIVLKIFAKKKKIYLTVLLDMLAPAVCLAQGIGRWGNFTNGEAYGSETDFILRMGLKTTSGGGAFTNYIEVHPTFLYESLWCILGFVLLTLIYKKKKFNGQIFYMYMIWYGVERAFVEGLRTDSLYLFNTGIRVSQLVAAVVCIAGIVLMAVFATKNSKKNNTSVEVVEENTETVSSEVDENDKIESEENAVKDASESNNNEKVVEETAVETVAEPTDEANDSDVKENTESVE